MIFIDGKFNDPKTCPKSNKGCCTNPDCKGERLEGSYGFAGGYGLGGHSFCPECYTIYDFHPDQDEPETPPGTTPE